MSVGPAAIVGGAVVLGLIVVEPWPGFPPPESWGWVHVSALAAALLGVAESAGVLPERWRRVGQLVVCQAVVALILRPLVPHALSVDGLILQALGLGLGVLVAWANVNALLARAPGPAVTSVLLMTGLGIAAALALSGSLRLGGMAVAPAGVVAAASAVGWFRTGLRWGGGAMAAPVVAWAALLLVGTFYSELPEASVALLAATPAVGWAVRLRPIGRLGPRVQGLLLSALAMLPAMAAVGLALRRSPPWD